MALVVMMMMMENEIEAYVLHHYCQLLLIRDDYQQNWVEAVIAILDLRRQLALYLDRGIIYFLSEWSLP